MWTTNSASSAGDATRPQERERRLPEAGQQRGPHALPSARPAIDRGHDEREGVGGRPDQQDQRARPGDFVGQPGEAGERDDGERGAARARAPALGAGGSRGAFVLRAALSRRPLREAAGVRPPPHQRAPDQVEQRGPRAVPAQDPNRGSSSSAVARLPATAPTAFTA